MWATCNKQSVYSCAVQGTSSQTKRTDNKTTEGKIVFKIGKEKLPLERIINQNCRTSSKRTIKCGQACFVAGFAFKLGRERHMGFCPQTTEWLKVLGNEMNQGSKIHISVPVLC